MTHNTQNAPIGQPVCRGTEWLDALKVATPRALIDPARAAQTQGNFITGLLTPDGLKARVLEALRDGPAAKMALDAIAPGFVAGDVIELRALDPERHIGPASYCGRLDDPEQRAAMEAFIRDHMGLRNLYVGCNPRTDDWAGQQGKMVSGKWTFPDAADVPIRRNVVLGLDLKDAPSVDSDWTQTVDALRTELDPILVLNSGNGYHVWLPIEPVSGPDVAASTTRLAAAMAKIGSDNMADPSRIVRLPFTVNLPNASKRERGAVVRLAVTC